jgi:hypothetical protein
MNPGTLPEDGITEMTASGTFETSGDVRSSVAIGGESGRDADGPFRQRMTHGRTIPLPEVQKREKTGSPSEGTLAAAPTAGGSRPCHFHGKDQYRDEAFASVASALRLTRQRVDGLRLAKYSQRREASSVCSRIALRYHSHNPQATG